MNSTNKTANILIVDDDPLYRKVMAWALSHAGFAVTTAADGEEAMASLCTEPVDAIVSDVQMPRLDGLELLQHVRAYFPRVPVILMTGAATDEVRQSAAASGAHALLEKPVDFLEMIFTLQTALGEPASPDGEFVPSVESPRRADICAATV